MKTKLFCTLGKIGKDGYLKTLDGRLFFIKNARFYDRGIHGCYLLERRMGNIYVCHKMVKIQYFGQ